MTNCFDLFRQKVGEEKAVTDRTAVRFVYEGSMATEVSVGEAHFNVGLVYDNKEETDKLFLYIQKPKQFKNGTIFQWTDSNLNEHSYIVFDEEKVVKNVRYNKYLCFECNVQVDGTWGYMNGPGSTYVNTLLRQSLYEVSLAKPVLIMGVDDYAVASVLEIGDRYWRIIEKDNYTHSGLVFYYLEQYVKQKDSDDVVDSFDDVDDEVDREDDWVRPGEVITLNTTDGYFESSVELEHHITRSSVVFTVPYDVDSFSVVFKTGDLIRTKEYKVVM